ncbi:Trp biosynthesis-associated membrane protein [Arthrobacter agilis]|uniref:Trp biosynthesis-associated membrane protein n=1 Tax=Arthrobacter agilis TaxID=37921 RepID=UPI002783E523|nr:Trp biosynthesis-associated membrane protein [Arthrobacter agilis]MDQ0734556.1 putative membrane protein (TIGR02234 family) [Arthrobacter agilis]
MSAGSRAPHRLTRRGIVVMGIVVLALLAFGSTTQTWLTVRLPQEAVQTPDLTIPGSDAATPVTAFALVALAAALAVSIAGRVARWIIAVILVLSGVGIALSSAAVALDPSGAAEPAIGTAIGVSGGSGAEATASPMPWVAVVAGILLVLAAAWVVLAGRTWGVNRRYDTGAARGVRAPAGSLRPGAPAPSTGDVAPGVVPDAGADVETGRDHDRSDDATAADATAAAAAGPAAPRDIAPGPGTADSADAGSGKRPPRRANAHADEIDSWDELSRGNDPTS